MAATNPNDVILIVAENLIMAEDLRQSIAELVLDHPIIVTRSHEAVLAALNVNIHAKFAVIATTLQSFAASALAVHMSKSSTHTILTEPWDYSLANERGWAFLLYPFTSTDIQALIG